MVQAADIDVNPLARGGRLMCAQQRRGMERGEKSDVFQVDKWRNSGMDQLPQRTRFRWDLTHYILGNDDRPT